jgi:hypothetical protein
MDRLLTHTMVEVPLLLAQGNDDTNAVWEGWGSVIFTIGILTLGVILIIAALWFIRGMKIATTKATSDAAYRELAEKAATYQANLLEQQQRLVGDLSEVKARVERIEQILREVE